jgi:thiol-disulfide isomerase/thioredoxin
MTQRVWLAVAVALAVAFGAGLFARPYFVASFEADGNLFDLSSLPEELRQKHRDPDYLISEIKNYELMKDAVARLEAEQSSRESLVLPAGMKSVPLGQLYLPADDVHWPENVSGDVGAVLDAAKNGWVILNYWASWCAPCVHELPEMGEAVPLYADRGVTLVAVNTDPARTDSWESVRALFRSREVDNLEPLIVEDEGLEILLAASGQSKSKFSLPTNIVFAPGGIPYAMFLGGDTKATEVWTAPETLEFLEIMVRED